MYEVKNSKICNFWTFWPVIQLINHLYGIITKLSTKISRSAVFASCIARILNPIQSLSTQTTTPYAHIRSEESSNPVPKVTECSYFNS